MKDYICVSCWSTFKVAPAQAGRTVICPHCGAVQPGPVNSEPAVDEEVFDGDVDESASTLEMELPASLMAELQKSAAFGGLQMPGQGGGGGGAAAGFQVPPPKPRPPSRPTESFESPFAQRNMNAQALDGYGQQGSDSGDGWGQLYEQAQAQPEPEPEPLLPPVAAQPRHNAHAMAQAFFSGAGSGARPLPQAPPPPQPGSAPHQIPTAPGMDGEAAQPQAAWRMRLRSGLVLSFPTIDLVNAWASDKPADQMSIAYGDEPFKPYSNFKRAYDRGGDPFQAYRNPAELSNANARLPTREPSAEHDMPPIDSKERQRQAAAAAAAAERRSSGKSRSIQTEFKFSKGGPKSPWPKRITILVILLLLLGGGGFALWYTGVLQF